MQKEMVSCPYCRTHFEKGTGHVGKVIYQTRNQHTGKKCVAEKTQEYCAAQCAGYDQMAHEG